MDGEDPVAQATLKQSLYWANIYTEILAMEEKVLARIEHLMAAQSAEARREVELTNLPVVIAQAERFRQRLGYWKARIAELDGAEPDPAVKARRRKASAATTSPEAISSPGRRRRTPRNRAG